MKKLRLVTGPLGNGTVTFGWSTVSVWSSMSNAISNYSNGDVLNIQVPPPSPGLVVFGTSPYSFDGYTYQINLDLLPYSSTVNFQPNVTYYIGVSVDSAGGPTSLGLVESASGCLSSDVAIGDLLPGGLVINTMNPPFTTGCLGLDAVGTAS